MSEQLSRGTETFRFIDELLKQEISASGFANGQAEHLGIFGLVHFPFVSMGAISSLDLFGLDEFVLFAIYQVNRERYGRFADLGANLGLHSILGSKLGWSVSCFEPDPETFVLLNRNLELNESQVTSHQRAVGAESGERHFTRVLGNLTGSHLSGSKQNPYGELETFPVSVISLSEVMRDHDLLKIDVEGAEAEILCSTEESDWNRTDAVAEIGSPANAEAIFDHFVGIPSVSIFSQKNAWRLVEAPEALPSSHREGSIFISASGRGPFGHLQANQD